jgi:hypothetical protein
MIVETRDTGIVNAIINDPAIREAVAFGAHGLDVTALVRHPANITFLGAHGVLIFIQIAEDIYEAHAAVLPTGWGEWTYSAGHETVRRMFSEHDARALIFPCPVNNPRASWGARMLGAEPRWRGIVNDREIIAFGLTRDEWEKRTCQ